MFKIMTLNLWVYYDWENRKENITKLVNEQAPDCIALQEVQTNLAFSDYPQSDFIAGTDYKYRIFAPTYARNNQLDTNGEHTQRTSYGLAFVSKYPILSVETYFLRRYPDHDEENSVLFCTLDINGMQVDICTVHLANSDKHSDLHINELMDLCDKRKTKSILLGDFNNFNLAAYKTTRLKDYAISTDIATYTSMPKDNGTLDYIAVPTDTFKFNSVVCPDVYVSDHRALIATIRYSDLVLNNKRTH